MSTTIISQPKRYSFSKNLMPLTINTDLGTGATIQLTVSYAIGNGLGGFVSAIQLYQETLSADANGDVTFYIQNQLDAVLGNHLPKWGDGCKKMTANWASYVLQFEDFDASGTSGGSVGDIGATQGDEYFVYNGGISYEQWKPGLFFDFIDIDKNGDHTQKFWTWFKNNREVGINEPHYLSFLSQAVSGYSVPTVAVKVYYEDGTNATFLKLVSLLTSTLKGELYILPTGFDQLIDFMGGSFSRYNSGGSKAVKYDYWLFENDSNGALITETKTFVLDWFFRNRSRYFIFTNSLGCVDSVRLFFQEQTGAEYIQQQGTSVIKYDYFSNNIIPATNFNFNISEQLFRKANTGDSLRLSDLDAMRQLSLSDNVFEIVRPSDLSPTVRLLPINSTSKKIAYFKRLPNSPIYQLELEYQYAFTNVSYTPENLDCSLADIPNLNSIRDYFPTPPTVYYQINFQIAAIGISRYAGPTENLTTGAAMEAWLNANWGDVASFELDGNNYMICRSIYVITLFNIS